AGVFLAVAAVVAAFGWWRWTGAEEGMRQERQAAVLKLRQTAEVHEQLARAWLRADRFADALEILDQAVEALAGTPELGDLREHLDETRRRIDVLVQFYHSLDQTELLSASDYREAATTEAGRRSLD